MARWADDAARQALEGVTVEDTVNVTAGNGGALVNHALNQFHAPNEMTLLIHCEGGHMRSATGAITVSSSVVASRTRRRSPATE